VSRELLEVSSKRVETLLNRFSTFPPSSGARTDAEELVRIVSSLYGECLRTLVAALHEDLGDRSDALLERCCEEPVVASLLVTHALHPVPLEVRVERAIEALKPALEARSAGAHLLSVDEDTVSVRIDGGADVVSLVEQAVYGAAPEVLEVRCVGQTISLLGVS
jgi:hypothetical protein